MQKIFYRNLRDKSIQTLKESRVGSWVHIEQPSDEELEAVRKKYNLEEGLLKDAMDLYEVPRMEMENGYYYIFTRYPLKKNNQISTTPILFIIGTEVFITISREPFTLLEGFIRRHDFYTTQKNKLLLQFFALINTAYNAYFLTISREIRSSSSELEKITNKDIIQFVIYERIINDFHQALVRMNAVLHGLLSHHNIQFYEKDKDLIEDLLLSNDQLIELSKENLRSIVNIRDAYTTIMTNNTNRLIRFFTSITVILTLPMIISSFYGMNVHLPFADSPFAFIGILSITLVVTIGLLFIFIMNDWL